MITRVVLNAIDDSNGIQLVKVKGRADEILDKVERIQQFGFTSVPEIGAEGVLVFIGGNADHAILVSVDDRRVRPKNLGAGDAAMYTGPTHMIHMQKGGKFLIKSGDNELFQILETVLTSLGAEPMLTQQAIYQAQKAKITAMKGAP